MVENTLLLEGEARVDESLVLHLIYHSDAETDWDKPQRFGDRTLWMLEKWGSVDELKAHLATPHMKAFGPTVRGMRTSSTFHVLEDVLP